MLKKTILWLSLSLTVLMLFPIQTTLAADYYWIVVASSSDPNLTWNKVAKFHEQGFTDATAFMSSNGHYAVTIGSIAKHQRHYLDELKQRGHIPADSYLSSGKKFVRELASPYVNAENKLWIILESDPELKVVQEKAYQHTQKFDHIAVFRYRNGRYIAALPPLYTSQRAKQILLNLKQNRLVRRDAFLEDGHNLISYVTHYEQAARSSSSRQQRQGSSQRGANDAAAALFLLGLIGAAAFDSSSNLGGRSDEEAYEQQQWEEWIANQRMNSGKSPY